MKYNIQASFFLHVDEGLHSEWHNIFKLLTIIPFHPYRIMKSNKKESSMKYFNLCTF